MQQREVRRDETKRNEGKVVVLASDELTRVATISNVARARILQQPSAVRTAALRRWAVYQCRASQRVRWYEHTGYFSLCAEETKCTDERYNARDSREGGLSYACHQRTECQRVAVMSSCEWYQRLPRRCSCTRWPRDRAAIDTPRLASRRAAWADYRRCWSTWDGRTML